MGSSTSVCIWVLLLLAMLSFSGLALDVQQFPSFGLQRFDKSSNFESQFALFGNAKVGHGGAFLQITNSSNFSYGSVIYRDPVKISAGKPKGKASFGTYFTFSISPEAGDGLAFLLMSNGFASKGFDGGNFGISSDLSVSKNGVFAVEFDTKMDTQFGDLNDNHVGVDVSSFVSVKVANASHAKLVLNSGKKLQCWIDYEASSKRIEIRLSKSGEMRPIEPLLSCPIDLSSIFKNEQVWFGLSSSSANSSQVCKVYSWSFKLRAVPYWMHSQPLNPQVFTKDPEPELEPELRPVTMHKKSDCVLRILTAVIVGTGCGAMGAFFVMPEEFVSPKVEYDCDKMKVIQSSLET
ncbi:hypothetical protein V2J09_010505 [Rumex salicifolius]